MLIRLLDILNRIPNQRHFSKCAGRLRFRERNTVSNGWISFPNRVCMPDLLLNFRHPRPDFKNNSKSH